MSYYAKMNGEIFFDTNSNLEALAVASASFLLEAGNSGEANFVLPVTNIKNRSVHRMTSYIDIYRVINGVEKCMFNGRVADIQRDFDLNTSIYVEGLLSILNDSTAYPINSFNGTVSELIVNVIEKHNSQMPDDKKFLIGEFTAENKDTRITASFDDYTETFSRMATIVEENGGLLFARKEEDGIYLDWLNEYPTETNEQTVELAVNLLDFNIGESSSDLYTRLIPLGEEISVLDSDGNETGDTMRVTIESVNDGKDYIDHEAGVNEFGVISKCLIFEGFVDPAELLEFSREYLNATAITPPEISLSSLDLANIGKNIEQFTIMKNVVVDSSLHDQEREIYVCRKLQINMLDPVAGNMNLGKVSKSLTSIFSNDADQVNKKINRIINDYVTNTELNKVTESTNDKIENVSTSFTEIQTSLIQQTVEELLLDVRKSIEDLGYSSESKFQMNSDSIQMLILKNNILSNWFTFDENGFIIQKPSTEGLVTVKSVQTNDSYKFVDSDGNELFSINSEKGASGPGFSASSQFKLTSGDVDQWAIRRGNEIISDNVVVGENIDIVWIGG